MGGGEGDTSFRDALVTAWKAVRSVASFLFLRFIQDLKIPCLPVVLHFYIPGFLKYLVRLGFLKRNQAGQPVIWRSTLWDWTTILFAFAALYFVVAWYTMAMWYVYLWVYDIRGGVLTLPDPRLGG